MHFWDEAARRLTAKPARKGSPNPLRRFGFITTNSITQTFSRRVVERWMVAKDPLSLVYAVPDHPWMKSADKAAVRIAMTVAQAGNHEGVLAQVVSEVELNTDTPKVELDKTGGKLTAKLSMGADLARLNNLLANEITAYKGFMPYGLGFIVPPTSAAAMETVKRGGAIHVLRYRNGRDIAQRPRGVLALDFYGLSRDELRNRYPEAYQHLTNTVLPERAQDKRKAYRDKWWIFAEAREGMRSALADLGRFIVTTETAKHRYFVFLDADTAPDQKLRVIAVDNAGVLATLASRVHVAFALATGGFLEDRPAYQHTTTFSPFPFNASNAVLVGLGERLDAFRKERIAGHDFLTMTGLYNALERLRELDAGTGAPLTDAERDVYDAGQIAILKELHDEIDREVFAAYGWSDLADRLVGRPGGTTPSPHKGEDQQAAEEELLVRLVALNQARIAEEKAGRVHWLRPDFQRPRLAGKVKGETQIEADLGEAITVEDAKWPADGLDQIRSVRDLLARAAAPISVPALAAAFAGRNTPKRRQRVEQVLDTLVATGAARRDDGATSGYYLPR